jgi:hypothetical protein
VRTSGPAAASSGRCLGAVGVDPTERHLVAAEVVAQVVRGSGPPLPDEADPGLGARSAGLPLLEQLVEHGVEALLGRVPRLDDVVVERHLVDGRDGGVGVGVGGEQDAAEARLQLLRSDEQLGAGHPRHALVGDDQRHLLAASGRASDDVDRVGPRLAATTR